MPKEEETVTSLFQNLQNYIWGVGTLPLLNLILLITHSSRRVHWLISVFVCDRLCYNAG